MPECCRDAEGGITDPPPLSPRGWDPGQVDGLAIREVERVRKDIPDTEEGKLKVRGAVGCGPFEVSFLIKFAWMLASQ